MAHTENYITQAAGDARYQQLGALGSSNPSTIDPDDAGSAGVSSSAARQDHQHPITTGTPASIGLTGVNSESSGTGFARDLHVHAYNPPACRVFHSVTQSIPDAIDTSLVFDSESYDTDSMHSTSVNTGRITINTAGLYIISFAGGIAAAGDYSNVYCNIRLNGTTQIIPGSVIGTLTDSTNHGYCIASGVYKLSVGDFITVDFHQDNTANAARNLQASPLNHFSATWIGVG